MENTNPDDPNRGVMFEMVFWMALAIILLTLMMLGFSLLKGQLCAAMSKHTSVMTFGNSAAS